MKDNQIQVNRKQKVFFFFFSSLCQYLALPACVILKYPAFFKVQYLQLYLCIKKILFLMLSCCLGGILVVCSKNAIFLTQCCLSLQESEEFLSNLVVNKTIFAKVDRLAGIINFQRPKDPNNILNDWSHKLNSLMALVNKTTHLIAKEEMIHNLQ